MTRLASSRSKMPVLTQGVLSAAVAILAGCGGGGGGDSTATTPTPVASVTSAQASAVKADRTLLVTVQGQNLDQGLTASSTGCKAAPVLSTTAPNASTATTAYFTCTAAAAGEQTLVVKRTADGTTLKTVSYTIDPLLPTVSAAVAAGIGTDTPIYGQPMLITVNGADLDLGITVTSPNCAGLTQSTAAPFVSSATSAYFTCTPKAAGAQQATVKRNSDGGILTSVAYTVPVPVIAVASATTSAVKAGQPLLITLSGSNLDTGITVASPNCQGMTLLSAAPYASTADTAYYQCTTSAAGAQTLTVTRNADGGSLKTATYTVDPADTVIASAQVGSAMYSKSMLITVQGENLASTLTATSAGCKNMALSTTAPYVSTATTAYYQCTVSTLGDQQVTLTRTSDGTVLKTLAYTVPAPQVTMALSNGAGVNGNVVFTLAPDKTPITVDNFLNYVNTGFYNGTIFHRMAANFVVQGGGYSSPVAAGTIPTHKAVNAPIALEVGKGLSNTQWTVAMARTSVANSATSEFFINTGASNTFLDTSGGGYAVFGNVSAGTDVITAITTAPCTQITGFVSGSVGCVPIPNVVITSATQTR